MSAHLTVESPSAYLKSQTSVRIGWQLYSSTEQYEGWVAGIPWKLWKMATVSDIRAAGFNPAPVAPAAPPAPPEVPPMVPAAVACRPHINAAYAGCCGVTATTEDTAIVPAAAATVTAASVTTTAVAAPVPYEASPHSLGTPLWRTSSSRTSTLRPSPRLRLHEIITAPLLHASRQLSS